MITEIELENYRGFPKHKIPLRQTSVIVGRNNAGKSTIIEALKLISIVVSRVRHSRFVPVPDWLEDPVGSRGISPSLRGLDFEFRNLCYQYREPPAVIRARLSGNKSVQIYINSEVEELFAILRKGSRRITHSSQASDFANEAINVMPPIGRLLIHEQVRNESYVKSNLNTRLASLHFRNQIYYLGRDVDDTRADSVAEYGQESYAPSRYEAFVSLAESSWPHLRIDSIATSGRVSPELSLLVRDGAFVAEVGWVGSGLQAWLQTCWFLARCAQKSVVVLDEPDVFLHPDLQRRLFRLVHGHFDQVLIATHSTEVLAEVNPESVLIVDKDSQASKFAENIPAVQNVINNIGGAHNLQLTRLWSARKCIFIEGDDFDFLIAFHETIFPDSPISLSATPHISIKGFGNWKHAVGAAIGLKNAGDQSIKAYCILDPDYRTAEEHEEIRKESADHGLCLHIWERKEIENYVLVPTALARVIEKRPNRGVPSAKEVEEKIVSICKDMITEVFDRTSNEIGARDRKGVAHANKKARRIIDAACSSFEGFISICSGKAVVSGLSAWSKENYGVSFSALAIAREMRVRELSSELFQVVAEIEELSDFST